MRVIHLLAMEYSVNEIKQHIDNGFALMGGVRKYFGTGKYLLKPNMLAGDPPAKATTTHPAFVEAVISYLLDNSIKIAVGESPGIGDTYTVAQKCGIADVCKKYSIDLLSFNEGITITTDGSLIKQFYVFKEFNEFAGIVSLPKLKNHGMAIMTGGMKNLFGCIPGRHKALWHTRMINTDLFSQMICDLVDALNPVFCIMDAIVGQEGNGPRSGTPVQLNSIIMGQHPYEVDAVASEYIGYCHSEIPILEYYRKKHLFKEEIEVLPQKQQTVEKFKKYGTLKYYTFVGKRGAKFVKKLVSPRPVLDKKKCRQCGICYESCPVDPKAIDWKAKTYPKYKYKHCIRCFCCQEMCPYEAISVKYPLFAKIVLKS